MNKISPHDKRLKISLIICCVVVYILEGAIFNPFAFWNMAPLFISYLILIKGLEAETSSEYFASIVFAACCFASVMFVHIVWFFDWWGMITGSSIPSSIIILLPFYALALSCIFSLLACFVGWLVDKKKTV